jgi:hypothetical protein
LSLLFSISPSSNLIEDQKTLLMHYVNPSISVQAGPTWTEMEG